MLDVILLRRDDKNAKISRREVWPWFGWFIASLAGLYQFLVQTSTSVMIPDLEKAFSLNSLGVSLLSSSFFYTYLLCQIPAGMIIDYFKPRRTIVICQLIMAILCVVFAQATNWHMAGLSRLLMGLFSAPTIVAALYLAARSLPERYFTLVAGLTEMMGMLGGVAGEALLARCVTSVGFRDTMFILAGIAILMALLALLIVRDEVKREQAISSTTHSIWRDLGSMLLLPQAWINGLFCGLLFSLVAAFGAFWCIPFLLQLYGVSLKEAADASSMVFIGAAFGAPAMGVFSERLGHRRQLMIISTLIALVISLIIIYVPVSMGWMFVSILLLGFFSGVYLLPFAVMRDITPTHMHGAAMGYINMMCILIGAPLLQPLIGWLLHQQATLSIAAYQEAFLVIPVSLILALILGFFVRG